MTTNTSSYVKCFLWKCVVIIIERKYSQLFLRLGETISFSMWCTYESFVNCEESDSLTEFRMTIGQIEMNENIYEHNVKITLNRG